MYNSRLIKQLKVLSPAEIRRFSDFITAPFFAFNPKTIKLSQYLIGVYPAFNEPAIGKEKLFREIFGEHTSFRDQALHDQFSILNKCFQQFLAQLQYEKDVNQQEFYTMKAFAEKRDKHQLSKLLVKAEKKLLTPVVANPHSYLQLYLIHHQANAVFQSRKISKSKDRFAEMVGDLDKFYVSSKLKYACEMLNRQAILNISYDHQLTDKLISFLYETGNELLKVPLISIYSHIYLLLKQPSDDTYQEILTKLASLQHQPDRQETANIYAFLQNYCIKQLNAGSTHYLGELFRLYKTLLAEKLLVDNNGYISHAYVKNMVAVGLRLQEYHWVKEFIEGYKNKVAPGHREDVYHYNLAQYYYEQKQFREALKLLVQINYTDVFYQLDARALQMKIYYEMEEDDSLSYFVKAFKTYLKRNQELSRSQFAPYENLLKLSQKAYRLKIQKSVLDEAKFQEKWIQLNQIISETKGIANLHWLKRKMNELNKA